MMMMKLRCDTSIVWTRTSDYNTELEESDTKQGSAEETLEGGQDLHRAVEPMMMMMIIIIINEKIIAKATSVI
jgi:hypothetical protein